MATIESIKSHRIINSRGDWTIYTEVFLDDGSVGMQSVPAGASTGEMEAICISAGQAAVMVSTTIAELLSGEDAYNQGMIDQLMIEKDGSATKANLGGNSILSVSLAVCKAAAKSMGLELYQYIRHLYNGEDITKEDIIFPGPLFNMLNGGKHAHNGLSFQEFMVIPAQGLPINKTLEMGVDINRSLKALLEKEGYSSAVGDEGGFAPGNFTTRKALDYLRKAISEHYVVGREVFLGIDAAAGSFYNDGKYLIPEEELTLTSNELIEYYKSILGNYEIIYLEDGMYEKDYEGWKELSKNYSNRIMIVADDLVVTNAKILEKAIKENLANAVIVKPNQIGTLSETLDFVRTAKNNGMTVIVSHRSGETAEDTFIADLSIGVGADFIKSGAPVRGERVAKYNRLLQIMYG
ncbi:phosphopyruvate hydratase [Patescibacteria group bacterium]|nr:phosphopyruvate hydratase [Patescibacteria group bacterium]